jgi:hypothetical protein
MRREPTQKRGVSRSATQSAYEKHNVVHLNRGGVGPQWLQQLHEIFCHRPHNLHDRVRRFVNFNVLRESKFQRLFEHLQLALK